MKERPILFSGPMVRAILEGRKTQTRRILKGSTEFKGPYNPAYLEAHKDAPGWKNICPYGVPGDRLYVKEAVWVWCRKRPNGTTESGRPKFRYIPHASHSLFYVADHRQKPERASYAEPDMVWRYKTARYMPRWASRITLEITDVRVQRVQEISEGDARAEGITLRPDAESLKKWGVKHDPRMAFADLWDSINAKRGFGWGKKPWVWAISFKRVNDSATNAA